MHALAVITGGARGIGRAICKQLAADGCDIVVVDIDPEGREAAEELGGVFYQADVGRERDVRALAEYCSELGPVRALVSNAGVFTHTPLVRLSLERWEQVLSTNLTASFLLAREFQPIFSAQSSLTLVSSTRAHQSEPDTEAYAASKGGLVALGHALAISMGPRTRVNVVSPGWIHTGNEPLSCDDHRQHPAGRVGQPEDVAKLVSYLVSDAAEFITGSEFIIDGGMTRKMVYTED